VSINKKLNIDIDTNTTEARTDLRRFKNQLKSIEDIQKRIAKGFAGSQRYETDTIKNSAGKRIQQARNNASARGRGFSAFRQAGHKNVWNPAVLPTDYDAKSIAGQMRAAAARNQLKQDAGSQYQYSRLDQLKQMQRRKFAQTSAGDTSAFMHQMDTIPQRAQRGKTYSGDVSQFMSNMDKSVARKRGMSDVSGFMGNIPQRSGESISVKDMMEKRNAEVKKGLDRRNHLYEQSNKRISSLSDKQSDQLRALWKKNTRTVEHENRERVIITKDALKKQTHAMKEYKMQTSKGMAGEYFQTGFSMHIMQMYALPIVYTLNRLITDTLTTFADFDKKFQDYVVKSQEYADHLSKSDIFNVATGQVFTAADTVVAAERFAASGIDVSKNTEALNKVMQVATIAQMDFNEAANGVIRTMQALHMNINETSRITDSMINSANASTAELKDLVGWFEYSAASAYNAGLSVEQLSAMLGVLSSTGLPNTGTAMRQFFMQMSKEQVQGRFMERFSWIDEDDFYNMDQLVRRLRDYVSTQENQIEATREITQLIGGKVTAQNAMNNLLMAEPELWNNVYDAVERTGSTQSLYNDTIQNAGHLMDKLSNSFKILKMQIGQVFYPILWVAEKVVTGLTSIFNKFPTVSKMAVGAIMILTGALGTGILAFTSAVAAIAVMNGAIQMFEHKNIQATVSTNNLLGTIWTLGKQLWQVAGLQGTFNKQLSVTSKLAHSNVLSLNYLDAKLKTYQTTLVSTTAAKQTLTHSLRNFNKNVNLSAVAMNGAMGAMMGYFGVNQLLQNQMVDEARLLSVLVSSWMAYQGAKAGGILGAPGSVAGAALGFGGSYAFLNRKIDQVERQIQHKNIVDTASRGSVVDTNINIENAYISDKNEYSMETMTRQWGV